MSIRMRLIWSYAAMLVVPLVVILLTALLLAVVSGGDFQYYKKLYFSTAEQFDFDDQYRLLREIKRATERNPQVLSDSEFLKEIETGLQSVHSGLVIRQGGQLTYVSDTLRGDEKLAQSLPPFERAGIRDHALQITENNKIVLFFQYDYLAPDGSNVSAFIVTRTDPFVYWIREAFPILFTVLIVILVLTHLLLTYFVSRSIIRPLRTLRGAAMSIKNGDLDFEVDMNGRDEISQLGQAFEEMRVQLKHSIRLQLQYEENRKELVSNISHDLKTPITTIRGYVDGLMDGVADSPEKSAKYMQTIADKAEEMDRLIDELFLYSKLDLRSIPFNFEPVRLREFMEDWSDEMKFDLEKAGIAWSETIRLRDSDTVLMDRDKFKRVLGNVIQNSRKYMDKADKRIALRTLASDGKAVIEIEDNGQGIEAEALGSIFERFFRAEQSRNSGSGGSGLGLAIARQIALGHGGTIEAASEFGQGTTIRIILPLADGEKGQR
ncbi:sensor histidine kinase [Cohnella zeiphila]|uniref:histidine kinase n=1 Tax=Cohnella zeiphila TaxID=2761120 RepID=A0A7X0VX53_9BACL|nr:HAMP domain-containing sensor histidine kinase [Cohnella zeiphila]MBB6733656.1 HAMP domain-containing histidine kinase [Cohnella zeiphila]